uniref:Heme O synthase n=1 Tax=Albugo laibachii Nc14 TaxID=890382 RepID=F0WK25_9STRA|nr:protoheme IX farnesyltransferase putative [Albugo laibachii Nc14]|eukprot:CCA21627.1 protoheme IX farnesyltransferase putative [Albugo laibachii Nc14]
MQLHRHVYIQSRDLIRFSPLHIHYHRHQSSLPVLDHVKTQVAEASDWKTRTKHQIGVYNQLGKVRLSTLVVMSSSAGFLMAGGPVSWVSFASLSVGTGLAAISANTFNQVIESDLDAKMKRTCKRPLPLQLITHRHAIAFGSSTAALSTILLGLGCNVPTAALGLFNIGLYTLVYTPSKVRTEWNTWIGSIVGAVPPVMGWAAATGSIFSVESVLQAALLFCWQMPHFFALSWKSRKDYARGGYKMVPCADPTGARTSALALRYSFYLLPIPIAAYLFDTTSCMFAIEGTLINVYAIHLARKFRRHPTNATAHQVFMCSLWYLPVILTCMVLHSQNWWSDREPMEIKLHPNSEEITLKIESESQSPLTLSNRIRALRRYLKGICIHEKFWGEEENAIRKADSSRLLCPGYVHKSTQQVAAICREFDEEPKPENQ